MSWKNDVHDSFAEWKIDIFLVHISLDPTPVTNYKLASVGFAEVYGSLTYFTEGHPVHVHVEQI